MFENYIKTALRNVRKHWVYSLISITGLTVGIAVSILIYLFVEYETGFDSHIKNKKNMYQVVTHVRHALGEDYAGSTPFPTTTAMQSDFPDMEKTAQMLKDSEVLITVGEKRSRMAAGICLSNSIECR